MDDAGGTTVATMEASSGTAPPLPLLAPGSAELEGAVGGRNKRRLTKRQRRRAARAAAEEAAAAAAAASGSSTTPSANGASSRASMNTPSLASGSVSFNSEIASDTHPLDCATAVSGAEAGVSVEVARAEETSADGDPDHGSRDLPQQCLAPSLAPLTTSARRRLRQRAARALAKTPRAMFTPVCSVCAPEHAMYSVCLQFLLAEATVKASFHRLCWGDYECRLRHMPWLERFYELLQRESSTWRPGPVDLDEDLVPPGLLSDAVLGEADWRQRLLRFRTEMLMRVSWATFWRAHASPAASAAAPPSTAPGRRGSAAWRAARAEAEAAKQALATMERLSSSWTRMLEDLDNQADGDCPDDSTLEDQDNRADGHCPDDRMLENPGNQVDGDNHADGDSPDLMEEEPQAPRAAQPPSSPPPPPSPPPTAHREEEERRLPAESAIAGVALREVAIKQEPPDDLIATAVAVVATPATSIAPAAASLADVVPARDVKQERLDGDVRPGLRVAPTAPRPCPIVMRHIIVPKTEA